MNYYRNRLSIIEWIEQLPKQYFVEPSKRSQQKPTSLIYLQNFMIYFQRILLVSEKTFELINNLSKVQNLYFENMGISDLANSWEKNQILAETIKDFCQDLMYYAYVGSIRRKSEPKCFIGYYQLIKNFVNVRNLQIQTIHKIEEFMKGRNKTKNNDEVIKVLKIIKKVPQEVFSYSEDKLIRVLFCQSPYFYIQSQLSKLEQSSMIVKIFYKELSHFITKRFEYLTKICSINIVDPTRLRIYQYFLFQLRDLNQIEKYEINLSIDEISLCIIYSIYRFYQYSLLFADIVQLYERHCQFQIDRQRILQFYNTRFIISKYLTNRLLENLNITQKKEEDDKFHCQMKVLSKKDEKIFFEKSQQKADQNGLRRQQINEEKSIFDMFQ